MGTNQQRVAGVVTFYSECLQKTFLLQCMAPLINFNTLHPPDMCKFVKSIEKLEDRISKAVMTADEDMIRQEWDAITVSCYQMSTYTKHLWPHVKKLGHGR